MRWSSAERRERRRPSAAGRSSPAPQTPRGPAPAVGKVARRTGRRCPGAADHHVGPGRVDAAPRIEARPGRRHLDRVAVRAQSFDKARGAQRRDAGGGAREGEDSGAKTRNFMVPRPVSRRSPRRLISSAASSIADASPPLANDLMPFGSLPTSGGGLRCYQLMKGLEAHGVEVLASMPGFSYLALQASRRYPEPQRDCCGGGHPGRHLCAASGRTQSSSPRTGTTST